ncbi:RHS repeat-associated core domain-containing protein [Pasteurella sp. PK-2025]|uniref:RHS repeat-associated core domain-containing protein n=1 Tax=Pasteurella sp. PK-2025 TaxID=3413133 RepID=UPI003C777BEE
MWYYQYDALGRRISKACPQQQLRITYLWDGDQLAYTQTVKQDKLVSQRHSVFHGWQLIAQQDRYQQSQQTLDGNKTEWKHETHYAICQPNGQVLALLNQQGKLKWKDEKRSVWGLLFPNDYRKTSPLDPQLLFAGQYTDQESGLAYNRFRYYDPESGNYISSDPIGLQGGERPFGYVGNPLDWVDVLGLSSCKLAKQGDDLFVGTYNQVRAGNIKSGLNSSHTPHHAIQNAASPTTHGKGIAINLRKDLHQLTWTYKKPLLKGLTNAQYLARDIKDLRKILSNAGYNKDVINTQLKELIRQNKELWKNLGV